MGKGAAINSAKKFIGNDNVAMILGDNFFYGQNFTDNLKNATSKDKGATIFGYQVKDPERFGVVNFDIDASVEIWKFFSKYDIYGLINQISKVNEFSEHKKLIKIIDVFGRTIKKNNQPVFYIYDDGTVEKKLIVQ